MKKLIFICFVILSYTCYCQEKDSSKILSGFWGINFGSSPDEVKSIMKQKSGCVYSSESIANKLIYTGGQFAGEEINFVAFIFYKDKFYKSLVSIIPSSESRVFSVYKELKDNLSSKYFMPYRDVESYDHPYVKGDGYELSAIKLDKAQIGSFWQFDNALISLLVSNNLTISLFYTDSELSKIVTGAEKKQNIKDL